jgi:3beta-hydroxy-delta5-steroid dehydrogenase/steroid delta-isomerase
MPLARVNPVMKARDLSPLRHRPARVPTEKTGKRYLVVGGHGLLGSHLVEGLLARGEQDVHVLDRVPSPLFADEVKSGQVTFHQGEITDLRTVRRACQGAQTVLHTAAHVNYWADQDFEYDSIAAVNVTGTENVVKACQAEGVQQLLHTSSTSVVVPHDLLRRPILFGDERLPYPEAPYLCHYVRTKVLAERSVLGASGSGNLVTAALRPGGLFGPRDQVITAGVRAGLPGAGLDHNVIDHVYVENVVHAFLLLERCLEPDAPAAGQAYFITNYSPVADQGPQCDSYAEFNRRFAAAFGRSFKQAPPWALSAAARVSQTLTRVTRGGATPYLGQLAQLRPSSLTFARATFYFSCLKAFTHLGYAPLYTVDEGMAETAAFYGRSPAS